jgi:hypothetical protein
MVLFSVHGDTPRSHEEWTHLLSISDQFEMAKVHKRAIKELASMQLDPVDRIVLAVDHDVPEWLDPAYVELCKREDPLREEEAEKVGLSTMVKLCCAREKIRTSAQVKLDLYCQRCNRAAPTPQYCPSCGNHGVVQREDASTAPFDDVRIGKVVADIFHPVTPTPITSPTPLMSAGNPDCPPDVPESHRPQLRKKGLKGGAKKKSTSTHVSIQYYR